MNIDVRMISHRIILCVILVCSFHSLPAQTVDQIKQDRVMYLWGQGKGITLKQADKEALNMLINAISTFVEASDSFASGEKTDKTGTFVSNDFKSVINTYSQATLNNTERIVISNEPDAQVFRYIKRSEIAKVFAQRKQKIMQFVASALRAQKDLKVADALRYYYWSVLLLKSLPSSGDIYYDVPDEGTKQLISWLPQIINNTLGDMQFYVNQVEEQKNLKLVHLKVTYQGKPISNFDYTYWNGRDWSNIISAKDGTGFIELYGILEQSKEVRLKAEYIFEGEARIDRELENVMGSVAPIPFRKSYYQIPLRVKHNICAESSLEAKPLNSNIKMTTQKDFQHRLNHVFNALQARNYQLARDCFTDGGFETFTRLLGYGRARLLDTTAIKFMQYKDQVMARTALMSFDFKTNGKKFVEGVCFDFNRTGKITNVTFSLSHSAVQSILGKTVWTKNDRMTLIRFLENYKTAYALKRLKYIENIFADDALIITGREVKVREHGENGYLNNTIVKFNKQTKKQYIKNLRYSFASKEFVNLKFEESKIRKGGVGGNVYGVQIKQNYYSSNYGDVGYLFLIVDLNKPQEPVIQVRTWQPMSELTADESIYDITSF